MNPRERPTPLPSPLPPFAADHQPPRLQLRPYPRYQPSGVEWLGEIPAHWEVLRLKSVLLQEGSNKLAALDDQTEVTFLPMEQIGSDGRFNRSSVRELAKIRNGYTYFQENNVIVAKITPCFENGKGALMRGLVHGVGFGSTELHVLRPSNRIDAKFLYYLTFSTHFREAGVASMYGASGQKRVPEDFVLNYRFGLPPLQEQRAIAAYLDCETGRIDQILAHHEKMIELLEEQRTSIISRAVTRGLHDDVPLKVSGVDWLGEIPAHWEILRLKSVLLQEKSNKLAALGSQTKVTFLPMEQIGRDGRFNRSSVRELAEISNGYTYFQENDVVVAKITPCFENGKGALMRGLIHGVGFGTTELHVLRPSNKIDAKFLYYLTFGTHFREAGIASMYGASGQKRVPEDFVLNYCFGLPPAPEQRAIATHLDRAAGDIDATISQVRSQIDLLREYRATLITSVVTGKVDVSSLL